jgi:hypothetical protein
MGDNTMVQGIYLLLILYETKVHFRLLDMGEGGHGDSLISSRKREGNEFSGFSLEVDG